MVARRHDIAFRRRGAMTFDVYLMRADWAYGQLQPARLEEKWPGLLVIS